MPDPPARRPRRGPRPCRDPGRSRRVVGCALVVVLLTTAPAHGAWKRSPVAPAASGVTARSRPVEVDPPGRGSAGAVLPPGRGSAGAVLPAAAVAPVGGAVVRPFDPPASPYGSGHRGVDLAATPGEVVRAALPGTVTFAGVVAGRAWVTVAHGDGLLTTYGALRPIVVAGQRVAFGQPLGRATARGTVDWGARRDGAYVDPMALLGVARVRLVPVGPDPGAG